MHFLKISQKSFIFCYVNVTNAFFAEAKNQGTLPGEIFPYANKFDNCMTNDSIAAFVMLSFCTLLRAEKGGKCCGLNVKVPVLLNFCCVHKT